MRLCGSTKDAQEAARSINETPGSKAILIVGLGVLLVALQLLRWGIESLAFMLVPHTLLTNELVRTAVYLLLTGALVGWSRLRGVRLPVAPGAGRGAAPVRYGAACLVFAALFASTPFATGQAAEPAAWAALACGAIATPVFEELLFRGYVWDRLQCGFARDWQVLVVSAVLFGLWHLGYADAVAWRVAQPDMAGVAQGLPGLMKAKVAFGSMVGVVLGYLRLRTGGCLAPMLFHGCWNVLA